VSASRILSTERIFILINLTLDTPPKRDFFKKQKN
jgi:hypothetical protein